MALTSTPYDTPNNTLATAQTSGSISYSAGQPIILEVANATSVTLTPSSSAGLSWTLLGSNTGNGGGAFVWYAIPASAGTTTVTVTGSGGWYGDMRVTTYTGAGTPIYVNNGYTNVGSSVISQLVNPTSSGSALWMTISDTDGNFNPAVIPGTGCSDSVGFYSSGSVCAEFLYPTTNPLTSNSAFTLSGTTSGLCKTSWVAYEVPSATGGGGGGSTSDPCAFTTQFGGASYRNTFGLRR